MRKLSDEEIQKIIEENLQQESSSVEEKEDLKTYRLLFDALETKPSESLSFDFADKVVQKIGQQNTIIDTIKFYGLILFLILIFLAVAIATFVYVDSPIVHNGLIFIDKFKDAIVFGLISISIIQILDQLLIKNKMRKLNQL